MRPGYKTGQKPPPERPAEEVTEKPIPEESPAAPTPALRR